MGPEWRWPAVAMAVVAVPIGFYAPAALMTRVGVRCPKCGGRARMRVYAWKLLSGSAVPGPVYAYGCESCDWCTYRRSAYRQGRRRARAVCKFCRNS